MPNNQGKINRYSLKDMETISLVLLLTQADWGGFQH